jgi:hypothetical protein
MKSKSLLIFLLGCSKMLVGQDSLKIETVQDSAFVAPQYSSVYDDVFMNKKETKWLFKVDALGLINLNGYNFTGIPAIYAYNSRIKVDFEHKLLPNISLNYSAEVTFANQTKLFYDKYDNYILGIEPRLYLKNKRKDGNGQINNLNGNYISLNGSYSISEALRDKENNYGRPVANNFKWAVIGSYGIQKRVFNHGYLDYQLGIGIGKTNLLENIRFNGLAFSYWFHNKFTLGLAFGGGNKSQTNTCALFRCYEEERSLWKIDIRNLYKNNGNDFYKISINPEYEFKIKKSSFSLNTGIGLNYNRSRNFRLEYGIRGTIEPRYYYNLKKRIAQGKSANNLSGGYFSIELSGGYYESIDGNHIQLSDGRLDTIKRFELKGTYYAIEPKWGIQKRLFKNGFMDFSFSLFRFKKSFINSEIEKNNQPIIQSQVNPYKDGFQFFNDSHSIPLPNMYFKIGFAF